MDSSSLNLAVPYSPWLYSGIQYFFIPRLNYSSADLSNPHKWPYPWNELFLKTSPNPSIIITYFYLSKDFTDAPDLNRKKFLLNFIFKLSLPKGSISFWPYSVYYDHKNHIKIDIFMQTLEYFSPSVIICFGEEHKDRIATFFSTSNIHRKIHMDHFLFLPSIETLYDYSSNELNSIITNIQNIRKAN